MLMIISPAKTFTREEGLMPYTPLRFEKETRQIVQKLQNYSVEALAKEMKMSTALAEVNHQRYAHFDVLSEGKPAIDYYYGEAFKAMATSTLNKETRQFMNRHLGILSGLYGYVKPLDVIKAYRLEMAFKFSKAKEDQLYSFWRTSLTQYVLEQLSQVSGDRVLINLASDEYSKVLDLKHIAKTYPVLNVQFKVFKDGKYKAVSMYAKHARGLMVRYICEHQIKEVAQIKAFNLEGYQYDASLSTETEWVFIKHLMD